MGRYDSYVLRVWRRAHTPSGQWVARLEHIQGHESHSFHDRNALIVYLASVLADEEPLEGGEIKLGEKDQDEDRPIEAKPAHADGCSPSGSAESGKGMQH